MTGNSSYFGYWPLYFAYLTLEKTKLHPTFLWSDVLDILTTARFYGDVQSTTHPIHALHSTHSKCDKTLIFLKVLLFMLYHCYFHNFHERQCNIIQSTPTDNKKLIKYSFFNVLLLGAEKNSIATLDVIWVSCYMDLRMCWYLVPVCCLQIGDNQCCMHFKNYTPIQSIAKWVCFNPRLGA